MRAVIEKEIALTMHEIMLMHKHIIARQINLFLQNLSALYTWSF